MFGASPDVPAGTNFEAKSYNTNNNTCKIKTLKNEVIQNGTQITEEEYLAN